MAAQTWFEAKLEINDGASSAYVEVADVVQVTIPEITVKDIEYITIDQADNYMKMFPASKNVGNIKCECNYSKTLYDRVWDLLGMEAKSFKFTGKETVPEVYTYVGYVSKLNEVTGGADDKVNFSFEITVTGAPTIA